MKGENHRGMMTLPPRVNILASRSKESSCVICAGYLPQRAGNPKGHQAGKFELRPQRDPENFYLPRS
jgi:hypothetical protein